MNPIARQGMGDELTNTAPLASSPPGSPVLRAAGSSPPFLTGTPSLTPAQRRARRAVEPRRPAAALGAPGLNQSSTGSSSAIGGLPRDPVVGMAIVRGGRHTRKTETDRTDWRGSRPATRSPPHPRRRCFTGRHAPALAGGPGPAGCRLPARCQSWQRRCGHRSEDSILLIGPPQSGKGLHVVINAIPTPPARSSPPARGPTTSPRPSAPDAARGAVACSTRQHLAEGSPAGLRWSPIRGCDDPLTAMIRATGSPPPPDSAGGRVGGGFWEERPAPPSKLLHAAALDGPTRRPSCSGGPDPRRGRRRHPQLQPERGDGLGRLTGRDDRRRPQDRDSIWKASPLPAALADPRVLDAVSQGPHEPLRPRDVPRDRGTSTCSPPVPGRASPRWSRRLSKTSSKPPAARRPLTRSAAGSATVARARRDREPRPAAVTCRRSWPKVVARGSRPCRSAVLAQARDQWNEHQAGAIWDASIVKIILGGASEQPRPPRPSTLIGERRVHRQRDLGDHGTRSNQRIRSAVSRSCRQTASAPALRHRYHDAAVRAAHRHRPARLAHPRRRPQLRSDGRRTRSTPAPPGRPDLRRWGLGHLPTERPSTAGRPSSGGRRSWPFDPPVVSGFVARTCRLTETERRRRLYMKIGSEHFRNEPDNGLHAVGDDLHHLVDVQAIAAEQEADRFLGRQHHRRRLCRLGVRAARRPAVEGEGTFIRRASPTTCANRYDVDRIAAQRSRAAAPRSIPAPEHRPATASNAPSECERSCDMNDHHEMDDDMPLRRPALRHLGDDLPEPPHPVNWNLLTAHELKQELLALNWVTGCGTHGLPPRWCRCVWHPPEWSGSCRRCTCIGCAIRPRAERHPPLGWHRDFADARAPSRLGGGCGTVATATARPGQTTWPGEDPAPTIQDSPPTATPSSSSSSSPKSASARRPKTSSTPTRRPARVRRMSRK